MSEVTNSLHQFILNLTGYLNEPQNRNLAEYLIKDISRICLTTPLNNKEIAYSCSLIFKRKEGFLEFLEGSVNVDAFKNARIEGLQFLAAFLDVVGTKVVQYGIDIKEMAFSVFLRDQLAKVKTIALVIVTKVLYLCSGRMTSEQLKIQEIVDKTVIHLAQSSSKISPTVKQQIFHLLGIAAHHYPECLQKYSSRLEHWYLNGLKSQIKSATTKLEPTIIVGCLQGLNEFLYQFPIFSTEDSEKSYALYSYIRDILGNTETNRYEMTKAALLLLSSHSPLFGQFLYEDSMNIYDKISNWTQHSNREVKHAGYDALDALLKQVSEMLIQDFEEELARGRSIFKFFIEKFQSRMRHSTDFRGLSSAVHGYGYFAKACKLYLGENDVQYMFNDMIKRSEQLYLSQEIMLEERIQTLPSFMDSIASIVLQLDEISEGSLVFLEHLAVFQVEHFPHLPSAYSFLCYNSLIRLLSAVSFKGSPFIGFLNRIVYQGIIRTCSHPVIFEVEAKKDQMDRAETKFKDPREITYKTYMPLWKNILNIVQNKELNFYNIPLEHRHKLTEMIYDEIISVLLIILQKLDLDTSDSTTNMNIKSEDFSNDENIVDSFGTVSDPLYQLQPNKPKDFQVFINIVDFTRDFLLAKQPVLFEKWIYSFGLNIIQHINKNPYVSGFYKLASVCLTLCSRTKYFQDIKNLEVLGSSEMKNLDKERVVSFKLFAKFSREIVVHLQQFKDDLLASCLGVILSLPIEIVESEIQFLIPALQLSFNLGLSFLPLAFDSLEALELWIASLPTYMLKDYYPDILPLLNNYFLTTTSTLNEPLNKVSTIGGKKSISIKAKFSRDVVLHDERKVEVYDSELTKVQLRILKLLGSLGNHFNSSVTAVTEATMNEIAISWDSDIQNHLKFTLPFVDIKLEISLDKFLPRIVKLATSSSNRHTKVAACELLHAVVLYMVGCEAQKTEELQRSYPMEKLYKNILPALLQLACDVELVARQLFEPLVLQLIHWFTNKRMIGSPEISVFLQVIWDGLTQSKDTAYRDFSAKCIREFVQWSIKQTTKKEQQTSPINMKAVLSRLYNYSLHPSPFKRLGAALAFNNIYTVFREEESLVNMFTLEILVHFVDSLAIAHYDEKSLSTQEKCKQALDHLARIMKVKSTLLNKQSKDRRPLRNVKEATMSSVVIWLLERCGCIQIECRHKCMELVFQLSPCLPGFSEPKGYFGSLLEKMSNNFFNECFEREMPDSKPDFNSDNFNLKEASSWLEALLTMLDCYTWLFGQHIFKLQDLFPEKSGNQTKLFKSLDYYLSSLCDGSFDASTQTVINMKDSTGHKVFSPRERSDYTRTACTVTVRLLNFITVIVENSSYQLRSTILAELWSENLWKCIILSVIDPGFLGFDVTDIEIISKLPNETSALLNVFNTYLPKDLMKDFSLFIFKELLTKNSNINQLFPMNLNNSNLNCLRIMQLVSGYEQLINCKIWPNGNDKEITETTLANNIFTSIWTSFMQKTENKSTTITFSPIVLKMSRKLLSLVLKMGIKSRELILWLLDKQDSSSHSLSSSKVGILIFSNFQSEITFFAAANADCFIRCLLTHILEDKAVVTKILLGVLDTVGRTREIRKRYGKEIVKCVVSNWSTLQQALEPSGADEGRDILSILTKILFIDSSVVTNSNSPESELIFQMYSSLLSAKKSLGFKIPVLDLLPFFLCGSDNRISKIESLLDSLAADHFPLLKTEFVVGSPQYNDYNLAFSKILVALELTESLMLLKFVIKAMCRESSHLLEDDIQKSFSKLCRRSDYEKQKQLIDVSYKMFLQEDYFSSDMRLQIVERVCMSLLRGIHSAALINFFTESISEIMRIIRNKRKTSDEIQLVTKIGLFYMMEILYTRLSKDELVSKESRINASFCSLNVETGKELTTEITRCAHAARKENMGGEALTPDICRKYHCAAYNTVIAVICCTQTDVKFYIAFLFQENPAKVEYIWENIVDLNKDYIFNIELDAPMERKKKFMSIRSNRSMKESFGNLAQPHSSVHYISSAFLADSSLSEEVNQFDFSTSELAFSSSQHARAVKEQSRSLENEPLEDKSRLQETPVELEVDEINRHECMASLVALIQHMSNIGILSADPKEIPKWMDNICKKLEDSSVHRNVKLFISKLIINSADILQPYASYLLYPLMNLILNGTLGLEVNYFIVDVMVVLLSWSSVAIPEDSSIGKHAASSVLEFMMKHCFHPRSDVFRNNLEMIKTIVECWKERLDISTKVIYDNMCKQDVASKDNIVGIQLLGIIIANGLSPFQSNVGLDKLSFLKQLVKNMKNKYKDVYSPTAEVSGMIMDYFSTRDKDLCENFCNVVRDCITDLSLTKHDQFIICLHKIQHNFPTFTNSVLLNKVLFMLPGVHGMYRTLILDIIQSYVEVTEDLFVELKTKGFLNMLEHRDEMVQLHSLKILQNMLQILSVDEMLILFPIMSRLHKQCDPLCRNVIYEVMMHTHEKFCNAVGAKEREVYRYSQELLLFGLADTDLALRLTVHNFWSNATRLPVDTLLRLKTILRNMYTPATEHQFLQYATFLLMEMTSRSPDYNRNIFPHPLSLCKFQNYTISASWRQRHAPMTPLFIDSLSMEGSLGTIGSVTESIEDQKIRATVDQVNFDPTQDQAPRTKTYNWLTETSLDTLGDWDSLEQSSSSSLFTIGRQSVQKSLRNDTGMERISKQTSETSEKMQISSVFRLRRRFLKDREKTRLFFIRAEMRRKQLREEKAKEQKEKRESQVTMYRQYRIGELPDIEIAHCAIIKPLQALAQHDQEICRILFHSVISSICSTIKIENPDEYPEFCKTVSDGINNILKKSTLYNPAVVVFCEEVLYQDVKQMAIDCAEISIASQASNKQNIGILLLEDSIICADDTEPRSSRKMARHNIPGVSEEAFLWIKMAEIYKSITDYDTVRGIFNCSLQTQPETVKALELEARGDFANAATIYNELYNRTEWPNGEPNQAEIDMWDDALLQCYNCLTKWDSLETTVINHFQSSSVGHVDFARVWEDTYYQEHYLPFFIRSKLKLVIENRQDQSLLDFIDTCMKEENKKRYLDSHFAEELALLNIVQEKYDVAQYYANSCIQNFLTEWTGLNILTPTVRERKLQTLQKLNELQEFLEFMDNEASIRNKSCFKILVNKWLQRFPNIFNPIDVWDDIIMNRSLYMEMIHRKYQENSVLQTTTSSFDDSLGNSSVMENTCDFDTENFLMENRLIMKLKFAEAALHQGNIPVAIKHLKWTQKVVRTLGIDHHWVSCIHMYCKAYLEKANQQVYPQKLDTLLHAQSQLAKLELECPPKLDSLAMKHYSLHGQVLEEMADILLEKEKSAEELDSKKIEELRNIVTFQSLPELRPRLLNKTYELKCRVTDIAKVIKEEKSNANNLRIGDAFMELTNFCNRCLRRKEELETDNWELSSVRTYPVVLVNSLLDAMRYGNADAMRLFPRILQVIEIYPESIPHFIKKASSVPCWMYLSWINQLVALLDKPGAFAVHGIVEQIAHDYPNALIYPFNLSSEGYVFSKTPEGQKNKKFVMKLKSSLNQLPIIEDFIFSLHHLSVPHIEFKEYCSSIVALKKRNADKEEITNLIKRMWDNLFTKEQHRNKVGIGNLHTKVIEKFARKATILFGEGGNKILAMKLEEFFNKYQGLQNEMSKITPMPGTISLKSLSSWLSEFQSLQYSSEIEIPGQYHGKSKPLPEYHIKICSFDQNVLVLQSLTLPRRLIIRGNDEKEYKFLVKSGEDLRQDNRIEQLFLLMNDIYTSDAACSQRKLKLETYKVIPLTSRIGIIEWVDNTKVLKDFLRNAMTSEEVQLYDGTRAIYEKYMELKTKSKDRSRVDKLYGNLYKTSDQEICQKFNECLNRIPWNLFRRSFLKLSASLEAFVILRSQFIISHSVLCISQWLLGVGDRHASNFIISLNSGSEVGIDFGHAFGTATQFLPVPELMPFRLTQQYLNLMLPLKEKGIIQATMIAALSALRRNCDILLNTMDVFIKEPTVNWKENALKQKDAEVISKDSSSMQDLSWYPKQRIIFAKQKLQGINPCHVTSEELRLGHSKREYYHNYVKVCKGENKTIRGKLPENGLNVEQQVAALIDQATDPCILGRTFKGWEPWL